MENKGPDDNVVGQADMQTDVSRPSDTTVETGPSRPSNTSVQSGVCWPSNTVAKESHGDSQQNSEEKLTSSQQMSVGGGGSQPQLSNFSSPSLLLPCIYADSCSDFSLLP